jgi:hypothetical protein
VILNPFVNPPSDFYEAGFDKHFNVQKYLMLQLQYFLIVKNIEELKTMPEDKNSPQDKSDKVQSLF